MTRGEPDPARLADAEARHTILTALDTTLLVEAGAGSGKTKMLVARLVALLASGAARVEDVAAVTFTRKAASHLRRRFQAELEAARAGEKDPARRQNLTEALDALDRLVLGTIDSFCAMLLSERPLEAGIDPEDLTVELSEAELFRRKCFREFIGRRASAGGPVDELFSLGVTMRELDESFALFAEYPDVEPVYERSPGLPELREARPAIDGFLDRNLPLVPAVPLEKGRDDLQLMLLDAGKLRLLPDYETPAGLARVLARLRPAARAAHYKWGDASIGKGVDIEYKALREQIKGWLGEWRQAIHGRIFAVLEPALEDLRLRRAAEGSFTYADLLLSTRDLLRDFPAVRRAFGRRFRRLLVDEFQDTDPLQAEILLYLSSHDAEERNASRLRPRPGSLFVVGDPKQSIYRFRRADIAAYIAFRQRIEESDGRIVTLTTNFRAVPALTAAANDTFRPLFPPKATPMQAAFAPLDSDRSSATALSGAFRLRSDFAGNSADAAADANAPDVARFVRWAVDHGWPVPSADPPAPVRWSDFLVLTRTRDTLETYARALEHLGVPVDVSGSKALPISRGLAEMRPFLAAARDPDDEVSAVAFLSGPLCGVDDPALLTYRRSGCRFSPLGEAPAGGDARIARGLRLLAEGREDVTVLPPGAALTRIVARLGLVARLSAGPGGRTASGNLLKVLALARRLSGRGLAFRDIVERLAEDAPALDLEEMSVEPAFGDAVRLMNLHRAKGLEAPIVVLAEPRELKRFEPRRHIKRTEDGARGWFTTGRETEIAGRSTWTLTGTPPDWNERAKEEKEFEGAERTRLLYVAATRARDTLVVSLREDKPESGEWAPLRHGLKDLPAAIFESEPVLRRPAPPLAVQLPEALRQIAARRERASSPSYAPLRVTTLARVGAPRAPSAAEEARGAAWGRVLHKLLEAAMRSPEVDLRPLAANLLCEEEAGPERLDDVLALAASVMSSDLWKQARKAPRRFVEAPFALMVKREELGLTDGPSEVLLKGAIDLVFEEAGTWLIVDWKSDVVGSHLAELVAHYAPQVAIYRRYWEKLTKQPAKAGLFFLDNGHLEWIEEKPGGKEPPGGSSKGNTEKPVWRQERLFDE